MSIRPFFNSDTFQVFAAATAAGTVVDLFVTVLYGFQFHAWAPALIFAAAAGLCTARIYRLRYLARRACRDQGGKWQVESRGRVIGEIADWKHCGFWFAAIEEPQNAFRLLRVVNNVIQRIGIDMIVVIPIGISWIVIFLSAVGAQDFLLLVKDLSGTGNDGIPAVAHVALALLRVLVPIRLLLLPVTASSRLLRNPYRQDVDRSVRAYLGLSDDAPIEITQRPSSVVVADSSPIGEG